MYVYAHLVNIHAYTEHSLSQVKRSNSLNIVEDYVKKYPLDHIIFSNFLPSISPPPKGSSSLVWLNNSSSNISPDSSSPYSQASIKQKPQTWNSY